LDQTVERAGHAGYGASLRREGTVGFMASNPSGKAGGCLHDRPERLVNRNSYVGMPHETSGANRQGSVPAETLQHLPRTPPFEHRVIVIGTEVVVIGCATVSSFIQFHPLWRRPAGRLMLGCVLAVGVRHNEKWPRSSHDRMVRKRILVLE